MNTSEIGMPTTEFIGLQPAPGGILINLFEGNPQNPTHKPSKEEPFNRRLFLTKENGKLLAQIVSPEIDPNHQTIFPRTKSMFEIIGEHGVVTSLDPNKNSEIIMKFPINSGIRQTLLTL